MYKINLPDDVEMILSHLNFHGYQAYVIGGAIRNQIINQFYGTSYKIKDYDIVTNAPYELLPTFFYQYSPKLIGEKFGVIQIEVNNEKYEIAKFRIEKDYLDSRRPSTVQYTDSLFEDTKRRDFTMNAIAYSQRTGIIDYHNGIKDIENNIIKFIGDKDERINEDALRILRLIRFISQYGFENPYDKIESSGLNDISKERIMMELEKILLGKYVYDGLKYAFQLDIMGKINNHFSETYMFDQNNSHHSLPLHLHLINVVNNTASDLELRLAALYHDIGKPLCVSIKENGQYSFIGHEIKSEQIAEKSLKELRFPANIINNVCFLIRNHMIGHTNIGRVGILKRLNKTTPHIFEKLIQLFFADSSSKDEANTISTNDYDNICRIRNEFIEIVNSNSPYRIKDLNINGDDILKMGFVGKKIGDVLNGCLEVVIIDKVKNTKEELEKWIKTKQW